MMDEIEDEVDADELIISSRDSYILLQMLQAEAFVGKQYDSNSYGIIFFLGFVLFWNLVFQFFLRVSYKQCNVRSWFAITISQERRVKFDQAVA